MVACIVVNWNGWSDTLACLRTLTHQSWQPLEVIVVDNGSTDDSFAQIEEFLAQADGPTKFSLLQTGSNLGFTGGANAGMREALARDADFIWLLNNDTECPPDTLEKLVRTAEANPKAGLIGTVLYYHHDPSLVQAWSGGRINRWLGISRHYHAPTPQLPGSYVTFASTLIRADALRAVGVLYSGYFMYYDDSDLCLRIQRGGWTIAVAEDTAVLHKESASTGGPRNPFMEKTIAVSGMRFLTRHSPLPWLSIPAFLTYKLLNRVRAGQWAAAAAVLKGAKEYWQTRHQIFTER